MEEDSPMVFEFLNFGAELEIQIDGNNKAQCPRCKRRFRQLLQHFRQVEVCGSYVDLKNFKKKFQLFNNRKRQNIYRERKLMENTEETLRLEAKRQRNIRAKKLENDADGTRRIEAEKQRRLRSRKLGYDSYESFKNDAANREQQRKQRKQERIRKSMEAMHKRCEEFNAKRKEMSGAMTK